MSNNEQNLRVIRDAVNYYVERRSMANPKGWDHVLRVAQQAVKSGVYGEGVDFSAALAILATLASQPTGAVKDRT